MKKFLLPLYASLLMVYSSQGQQATPTPHDTATASDATEAENTKRNSSEQNKNTDTAEKQSNSKDDLALTQKVRQAVMKDGSLSMNAKNVKIIFKEEGAHDISSTGEAHSDVKAADVSGTAETRVPEVTSSSEILESDVPSSEDSTLRKTERDL
jgi:hypothetical protein